MGQAQQCGGIKPVNGLRNLPDSLPLKKNIHYNKNEQLQKHGHVNGRVNVCLKLTDNYKNMDISMAGSMYVCS